MPCDQTCISCFRVLFFQENMVITGVTGHMAFPELPKAQFKSSMRYTQPIFFVEYVYCWRNLNFRLVAAPVQAASTLYIWYINRPKGNVSVNLKQRDVRLHLACVFHFIRKKYLLKMRRSRYITFPFLHMYNNSGFAAIGFLSQWLQWSIWINVVLESSDCYTFNKTVSTRLFYYVNEQILHMSTYDMYLRRIPLIGYPAIWKLLQPIFLIICCALPMHCHDCWCILKK